LTRAAVGMVTFSRNPPFTAHGRNGIAKEHGKKFVARTSTPDAALMHENNLVDQ
jgi:hypothetical protein